jgi:DNA ligase-1
VEAVRSLAVRDTILDGEVIALRADGSPHPFQVTMQRFGRRLDVDRLRAELPLTPFFFDCLYVDGQPLLDRPQAERASTLSAIAPSFVVPSRVRPTRQEAAQFLDDTLRRGHEGVMAKLLSSGYSAEWGHGRRKGWLSNLHLGARDPEHGGFVMLGKTFKGLTDEMLARQTEQLLALEVSRDAYTVYVRPEVVVEIAFNDLQASPHYAGGLALRFARVKGYRPDKSASEADTIDTVREIHITSQGAK